MAKTNITKDIKAKTQPKAVGTIKVRFDAYNRGYFKKKLKVYFRKLKKPHTLKIIGYVF